MKSLSSLSDVDQESLLHVAHSGIHHGLNTGTPAAVTLADFPAALRKTAASFVTLKHRDALRGCIGTLEANRPLVADVNENAFAAAFRDPRFPPLSAEELSELHLSIAVLSPAEAMTFRSEQDLLDQIRAGLDGLILEDRHHRATFLPAVWDALPDPQAFFTQLKLKAGLASNHWSSTLRVYRYHTEVIERY